MTEQFPILNVSQNVSTTKEKSGSLLGRGLNAIQNKKTDIALSDLDSRYRQARDIYNRITGKYEWKRRSIFVQADLFENDLLKILKDIFPVFQQLANQGYGKAYFPLARIYEGEQGIVQNIEKTIYYRQLAFSWCSINQGLDDSEIWRDLGWIYYNGFGVEQDKKQAVFWYCKAIEQGDAEEQYNIGFMYAQGDDVEKDDEEAVFWYRKAAEQGHVLAQCHLGVRYYYGNGVEQDYEQALFWYRKAAEQNDTIAQCNLGFMYAEGYGVEKDNEEAVFWFAQAAEQGDEKAQCNLAWMYDKGCGVSQSHEEAIFWYIESAKQGYEVAQKYLVKLGISW